MNKDASYFDVTKDVATLEDDPHEFMVELFSSDVRAQRLVHVNPKQDDEQSIEFVSKRSEFKTHLSVPLKLRGSEWDVSLFQACFRNQQSDVYQVQFEDSEGALESKVFLPRRPYVTMYELCEEIALRFQRSVTISTDGMFRITGGLLIDLSGQQSGSSRWSQRCFDGPFLTSFPEAWNRMELINPSYLWYHVLHLWQTVSIGSTKQWFANGSTLFPFLQGHQPFSNLFFWHLTIEAFSFYHFPWGERMEGGLPRQHEEDTWWRTFGLSFTIASDYSLFRISRQFNAYPSYFYMVVSKKLAELMDLDEMIRMNEIISSGSVQRFDVAYDKNAVMIKIIIGTHLALPQTRSVHPKDFIFSFDEKGLIPIQLTPPPLYSPSLDGRTIQIQAGCLKCYNFIEDFFEVISLPTINCRLWKKNEYGFVWNSSRNWWSLIRTFNKNLLSSKKGKLKRKTFTETWGLLTENYNPYSDWPKVLVYDYTEDELNRGGYVLKDDEILSTEESTDLWKGKDTSIFRKTPDGKKFYTNLPADHPQITYFDEIFWMILPKDVVSLFDLETWGQDLAKYFGSEDSHFPVRFASPFWDFSKRVVYWKIEPWNAMLFPKLSVETHGLLQTRWNGVIRYVHAITTSVDSTKLSLKLEDHIQSISVIDPHTKFSIIDKQSEIILKKEELTSFFFQPWVSSANLETIVLSIPELEVRDVLLSYDSKTHQWVTQRGYQCSQPIMLPSNRPMVLFQGGAPEHTIKLRERRDGGLDTLTVILKSLDGTRSPAFYKGLTYIALYFRDRRFHHVSPGE